jgi:hypothetical protein
MFTHTLTALRAAEHQQQMQSEAALARRVRLPAEQPGPAALRREQRARRRPRMVALVATARQAAKLAFWL